MQNNNKRRKGFEPVDIKRVWTEEGNSDIKMTERRDRRGNTNRFLMDGALDLNTLATSSHYSCYHTINGMLLGHRIESIKSF